jgi:hypothetical protein
MALYHWEYNLAADKIWLIDSQDRSYMGCVAQIRGGDCNHQTHRWFPQFTDGHSGVLCTTPERAAENLIGNLFISNATGWGEAVAGSGWFPTVKRPVTPERVRDALLKDPNLLWGTLRALLPINLAGPWTAVPNKNGAVVHRRDHPTTFKPVVSIIVRPESSLSVWFRDEMLKDCEAATVDEAKKLVDAYLRDKWGYLLADEEQS